MAIPDVAIIYPFGHPMTYAYVPRHSLRQNRSIQLDPFPSASGKSKILFKNNRYDILSLLKSQNYKNQVMKSDFVTQVEIP
jgi:hypothetical protein